MSEVQRVKLSLSSCMMSIECTVGAIEDFVVECREVKSEVQRVKLSLSSCMTSVECTVGAVEDFIVECREVKSDSPCLRSIMDT